MQHALHSGQPHGALQGHRGSDSRQGDRTGFNMLQRGSEQQVPEVNQKVTTQARCPPVPTTEDLAANRRGQCLPSQSFYQVMPLKDPLEAETRADYGGHTALKGVPLASSPHGLGPSHRGRLSAPQTLATCSDAVPGENPSDAL